MKQDHQGLTAQVVILRAMERAARRGDMKTLEGDMLVLRAIIDSTKENTYLRQSRARSM